MPHRAGVKVEEGGVSGLVAPVCGVEGGAEVELVSEGVAGLRSQHGAGLRRAPVWAVLVLDRVENLRWSRYPAIVLRV